MNIYVGCLSLDVTDADLQQAFEAFGKVASATVIKDEFGTLSRGFGYVEMPDEAQAREAISGLDRRELKAQRLSVSEARPRTGGDRGEGRGGGRKPSPST